MQLPPPLSSIPRYPITAGLSLAAIAVTLLWWTGHQIDGLIMNGQVWENWQLWRALTSTLPHVNFFHLAFNLYWVWVFGTLLERVYGHWRFAGMVLLLAATSSCAEFTFLHGGVGLSGIGYGLWGILWVLEPRDPRFADAVDRRTSQLFIGWFFLCIVLTVTDVMPVGNIAHGVGAATGALLGIAISSRGARKSFSIAAICVLLLLGVAGSTIFWPWVNRTEFARTEVERAGVENLHRGNNSKGARALEMTVRMKHAPARAWYNLGVAYQRLNRDADALAAYEHAAGMPDADPDMREAARNMKRYLEAQKTIRDLQRR